MFTQAMAEVFVKSLLEDVFPNGKLDDVDNFYALDVIGHYGDETFGIQEIKERILAIKTITQKCNFIVNSVTVIDNFIAFSCKQTWINKYSENIYDALIFGIYRIKGHKIKEAWLIGSSDASYRQINQDFVKHMQNFELNQKLKQEFLDKLELVQRNHLANKLLLSDIEKECLYYYFNGFSAKEAALEMNLSPRTIETYLAQIKDRYDCTTKQALRNKFFPKVAN